MSIVFTNNSSTTLASAILYTATSFTVATGTGSTFPAIGGGDVAYITLTDGSTLEIVKVTGRSGDIFTCVRGQDGTTAAPWAAGTTVQLRTTAAALTGMMQKANNLSDLANAGNARTNLGVAIGSNVQAWDADLDAIAALTGTLGVLRKTASNTWTLDTTILSGSGLTNNGVLYSNSVGQVVNGTALTFDGSANFGFGGSNAATYHSFVIQNTATTGYTRMLLNAGTSVGAVKYAPGIFFAIGTDTDSLSTPMVFNLGNSSEQMRLTSTGLGIGTSSPNILTWNKAVTLNTASGNAAYELAIGGVAQAYFSADATNVYLAAYANKPLLVRTNNATVATFDTSGNLGLGVTPSAWGSGWFSYSNRLYGEYYSTNSGYVGLAGNAYYNGTNWIYKNSTYASKYELAIGSGTHAWHISAGGPTGSTISFIQAMTLDNSGNLGVGTTSPNASAILDAQSTTKGVRFPNMTTTQKNAVSSPAAGLVVFDTTLSKLCVYSGAAWQTITSV